MHNAPRPALQRRAQFYPDFVEAENSMGFHTPGEAERIMEQSIGFTRQGQVGLRDTLRPEAGARANND